MQGSLIVPVSMGRRGGGGGGDIWSIYAYSFHQAIFTQFWSSVKIYTYIIGASLSEPHTTVNSYLRFCLSVVVCTDRADRRNTVNRDSVIDVINEISRDSRSQNTSVVPRPTLERQLTRLRVGMDYQEDP